MVPTYAVLIYMAGFCARPLSRYLCVSHIPIPPIAPPSTIKALLDTQAEHRQQIAAQERQIRDVQALLLGSRKSSSSSDKACREEAARASARAAETAAGLSRLREGVSAARVREGSRGRGGGVEGGRWSSVALEASYPVLRGAVAVESLRRQPVG